MTAVAKTNATNYPLGYYYVTTDHAKKIDDFKRTSGDMETVLITQYVRGWLGKNRNFCLDLAKTDADSRGMIFSDWAKSVYEEGFKKLPPLKKELNPPSSPLKSIHLTAKEELVRRKRRCCKSFSSSLFYSHLVIESTVCAPAAGKFGIL